MGDSRLGEDVKTQTFGRNNQMGIYGCCNRKLGGCGKGPVGNKPQPPFATHRSTATWQQRSNGWMVGTGPVGAPLPGTVIGYTSSSPFLWFSTALLGGAQPELGLQLHGLAVPAALPTEIQLQELHHLQGRRTQAAAQTMKHSERHKAHVLTISLKNRFSHVDAIVWI